MFSHIFLTSFVYIISIILAGLRPWYNWDFYGFLCYLGVGKAADRHVLARMIREIEMSGDWFGCVLVISFDVS